MRLGQNSFMATAAALALTASGAFAADIHFMCTGVAATDTPGLQAAIASAVDGDHVGIHGDCATTAIMFVNAPNLTIEGGPGSVTRTGGTAFALRRFASGTTIQNLKITALLGNGISNTSTPPSTVFDQPDNISILNNDITSLRGIQQFNENAPPLNDFDKRNGLPGGLATGWVIDGNSIRAVGANNLGVFICGDSNRVTNNEIWAAFRGINIQSNVGVSLAAMPGASMNYVGYNRIHVAQIQPAPPAAKFQSSSGIVHLGCGACSVAQDLVPGTRSFGNVIEKNCIDVSDPTNYALNIGISTSRTRGNTYVKNDITLGAGTPPGTGFGALFGLGVFEDRVTNTSKEMNSVYANNDAAGPQVDGVLIFDAPAVLPAPPSPRPYGFSSGNLIDHNDLGPLDAASLYYPGVASVYSENEDAANPTVAVRNKWCLADMYVSGPAAALAFVAGGNHQDVYCSHPGELSQAHDCYQGLGYADGTHSIQPVATLDASRLDPSRQDTPQAIGLGDAFGLVPANEVSVRENPPLYFEETIVLPILDSTFVHAAPVVVEAPVGATIERMTSERRIR